MPLNQPIITIAFSRADLAERRAQILPDLVAAIIDQQRAHGDPEEVCAAYELSLTGGKVVRLTSDEEPSRSSAHSAGDGTATDAEGEAIQARRRTPRRPLQIRSGRTRV